MTSSSVVELKVKPLSYLSQLDESAFFSWLDKIPCVLSYEGRGDTLYVKISNEKLDEHALRELIALLYRYNRNMEQLAVFNLKQFATWFPDQQKYWHKAVFKQLDSNKKRVLKKKRLQ
jgi:hypothetical protein